jgi:hypothetical protein
MKPMHKYHINQSILPFFCVTNGNELSHSQVECVAASRWGAFIKEKKGSEPKPLRQGGS